MQKLHQMQGAQSMLRTCWLSCICYKSFHVALQSYRNVTNCLWRAMPHSPARRACPLAAQIRNPGSRAVFSPPLAPGGWAINSVQWAGRAREEKLAERERGRERECALFN